MGGGARKGEDGIEGKNTFGEKLSEESADSDTIMLRNK
jgi:hypothetical protein